MLEEIGPKITVGTRGYRTIEPTEPQRPQSHRAIETTEPQGGKVGPCLNPSHHLKHQKQGGINMNKSTYPNAQTKPNNQTKPSIPKMEYNFHIINDSTKDRIATIHYIETPFVTKATIQTQDESKLPLDIQLGNKDTQALLLFLKDRVLPSNRMFLTQDLETLRVDPSDWIRLLQLNSGRTYGDNYSIEVERKGGLRV